MSGPGTRTRAPQLAQTWLTAHDFDGQRKRIEGSPYDGKAVRAYQFASSDEGLPA